MNRTKFEIILNRAYNVFNVVNDEYENGACFFIIFVSDGKFDSSMGVRKRTDWNLPHI